MFDVSLDEAPSDEIVGCIENGLLEALGSKAATNRFGTLSVIARDRDGELVAGLIGTTSYGWLLVKMLWVAEAVRRQGLGRRLMQVAETEALRRGCHGAWLDTSSDRARQFYVTLGYEQFGLLENSGEERPAAHRRWFLRRSLASEDASSRTCSSAVECVHGDSERTRWHWRLLEWGGAVLARWPVGHVAPWGTPLG